MSSSPLSQIQFNAQVVDLQGSPGPIATGIGFLDHMIDQFNSHAQIGVSIAQLGKIDAEDTTTGSQSDELINHDIPKYDHVNVFANYEVDNQKELLRNLGSEFGEKLNLLLSSLTTGSGFSYFACPLDEALVSCQLNRVPRENNSEEKGSAGKLLLFTLAPYGSFPRVGRSYVGGLKTAALESFWDALAVHSGLTVSFEKVRGINAHHIIEAAFKAFCRAFRNLLDGVDTRQCDFKKAEIDESFPVSLVSSSNFEQFYGERSDNWLEGQRLNRQGTIQRQTKETSIDVSLRLNFLETIGISTGIVKLDNFLEILAQNAALTLYVKCKGDLWIDEHHTAEDVSIAIGQALCQALGSKAGLVRMWCTTATVGLSVIQVVMDLSNRPCFTHNLESLESPLNDVEAIDDLSLEMLVHVLDSLVINARITVHIIEVQASTDLNDTLQAIAIAFGRALKYCAMLDLRRCGATASSKGTLSV